LQKTESDFETLLLDVHRLAKLDSRLLDKEQECNTHTHTHTHTNTNTNTHTHAHTHMMGGNESGVLLRPLTSVSALKLLVYEALSC
jgi:hypothetical protein